MHRASLKVHAARASQLRQAPLTLAEAHADTEQQHLSQRSVTARADDSASTNVCTYLSEGHRLLFVGIWSAA